MSEDYERKSLEYQRHSLALLMELLRGVRILVSNDKDYFFALSKKPRTYAEDWADRAIDLIKDVKEEIEKM